jgi:phosphoserine/homoserine phosphotransferase
VIATLKPLDGAVEFVDWLRERFQVVILSDTFYEFSQPLMRQLGFPTLLCHRLITDDSGRVTSYQLRQKDPKRQSVLAFKSLYYRVIAAGDSYNDTSMLGEADAGILFHAPDNVIREFPQFPAVHTFADLKQEFLKASNRDLSCNPQSLCRSPKAAIFDLDCLKTGSKDRSLRQLRGRVIQRFCRVSRRIRTLVIDS